MPKINREEYEVLKGLNDKWKWIARDKDEEPYNIQELIDEYLDDEYGYFNMKLSREFEEFIKKKARKQK